MALGFKTHRVDHRIDCWFADDRGHLLAEAIVPGEVDRDEADLSGVLQPRFVHVADHDDGPPRSWAEAAAARPTGPAPATYTVEPGLTPAFRAPWKPVGRMSVSMVRSMILDTAWSLSGNLSRLKSA